MIKLSVIQRKMFLNMLTFKEKDKVYLQIICMKPFFNSCPSAYDVCINERIEKSFFPSSVSSLCSILIINLGF